MEIEVEIFTKTYLSKKRKNLISYTTMQRRIGAHDYILGEVFKGRISSLIGR